MPTTVTIAPAIFTPTGNPNMFQFTWSFGAPTTLRLAWFIVEIRQADTDALISTLKLYPRPETSSASILNTSSIVDSLTRYFFKTYAYLGLVADPYESNVAEYYLNVLAYRVDSITGIISEDSVPLTTDNFRVFKGRLDKVTFSKYAADKFQILDGTPLANFLTNKPDFSVLNTQSEEGLFFARDPALGNARLMIRIYTKSNVQTGFINLPIASYPVNSLVRANLSPGVLSTATGANLDTMYRITVQLFATDAVTPLSVMRTYLMEPTPCGLDLVNVYFANMYGATDSYQFVNPAAAVTVDQATYKRNDYSGLTYLNGGVYTASEAVLRATPSQRLTLNTRPLTDAQTAWLSELMYSPLIHVKQRDEYVPAIISPDEYTLMPVRYIRDGVNVKQVTLRLTDGILPSFKL